MTREPHASNVADPSPSTHTQTQSPGAPRPSSFPFLAPAQAPDEVGRLGGFRLLKLLGEGGMGLVFEAEDSRLGRHVAVKVMKPVAARHEEGKQRFLREARAAAAVQHDHVAPIHQVGEERGMPFLVMPLLKGESLEARLRKQPRLPAAEAARIARESAEGLAAAHTAGLVHRDVKPSNLWLEETPQGERVKVLDFGLARPMEVEEELTGAGAFMGTPGYTAPEQARNETVDGRADLFSLGCVLYRMLTGQGPFRGKTLSAVLLQVETHDPAPPREVEASVPADLSDLVMRLLSKDPAGRPASARETAEALRRIERSLPPAPDSSPLSTTPFPPSPANAPTASPNSADTKSDRTTPHRRKVRAALLILPALCVVLLLTALLFSPVRGWLFPSPPPPPAEPRPRPSSDPAPPVAVGWKGYIDVVIFDPNDPHRQNKHLNDPDVLPLKPGDLFAVEAQLDRPAYCYVLWIDADGTVDPVYPWKPGHWEERPADEQPVAHLRRPEASDRFAKIKESAAGMETLVLLVRDTPLPPNVDLRTELGPAPAQALQTLRSTVWFENGEVVKGETGRSATDWDEAKVDDPVRATLEQIRSRLGRWFPYTRAVSFADRGK